MWEGCLKLSDPSGYRRPEQPDIPEAAESLCSDLVEAIKKAEVVVFFPYIFRYIHNIADYLKTAIGSFPVPGCGISSLRQDGN